MCFRSYIVCSGSGRGPRLLRPIHLNMVGRQHPAFLRETALNRGAVRVSVCAIAVSAAYLVWRYPTLPDLLPVHFRWDGQPNGWQYRTWPRVLMPVFVQVGLFATFSAVSALLRSRTDASDAAEFPDARAATTAAETVMLLAAIWIGFQAYAGIALVALWRRGGASLGVGYNALEVTCLVASIVVAARAQGRLGRPAARPEVAAHWRLRQLYCNTQDPALFVPTRDGGRWTLNFGRRAAVCLLAGVLAVGIIAPSLILALALR